MFNILVVFNSDVSSIQKIKSDMYVNHFIYNNCTFFIMYGSNKKSQYSPLFVVPEMHQSGECAVLAEPSSEQIVKREDGQRQMRVAEVTQLFDQNVQVVQRQRLHRSSENKSKDVLSLDLLGFIRRF